MEKIEILPYDRKAAAEYARKWALGRNPAYYDFSRIGGDCTNFASQCLYAGAKVMNFTPVTGWFYINANDRTASWTGVEYFYRFLVGNDGPGPFAEETDLKKLEIGDFVQLGRETGDFYPPSSSDFPGEGLWSRRTATTRTAAPSSLILSSGCAVCIFSACARPMHRNPARAARFARA